MRYIVLIFVLASCSAYGAEPSFAENFAEARENQLSAEGARYDALLGATLEQRSGLSNKIARCLRSSPGPKAVHGYLLITSARSYKVELQPDSKFSRCLGKAFSRHRLPAPPRYPYLNAITFALAR